jgi:hypothetical protein
VRWHSGLRRIARRGRRNGILAVAVFSAFIGLWVPMRLAEVRRQMEAAAQLEEIGFVLYDDERPSATGEPRVTRDPTWDQWRRDLGLAPVYKVDLYGARIRDEDLDLVSRLTTLRKLNLQLTPISDAGLARLSRLRCLETLHLSNTRISDDGLRHLADLQQLRCLGLSQVHIRGPGLRWIGSLTNLRKLSFISAPIEDDGLVWLSGLRHLETLSLSSTRVTDAGLPHLYSLRRLQALDLGSTAVTTAGLERLRQALPNTRITYSPGRWDPSSPTRWLRLPDDVPTRGT